MKTKNISLENKFSNSFNHLAMIDDRHTIWKDFLQLSICAFHSFTIAGKICPLNESTYFKIVNRYKKDDFAHFVKMLVCFQEIIINTPYRDFLGEFYMANVSYGRLGQYFTPMPIAEFMAFSVISKNDNYKTIHDPACGSGVMLIAAAKISPNNYFYGADLDNTCVLMASLNCFIHGLNAEIVQMNSLSNEFFHGYKINQSCLGIMPFYEKEKSFIWQVGKKVFQEKAQNQPIEPKSKNNKDNKPLKPLSLF